MSEELIKCPYCKELIDADAKKCKACGEIVDPTLRELENLKQQNANNPIIVNNNNNNNNNNEAPAIAGTRKSRVTYILLALFLGGLGIHNFYAGRTGCGVGQLLITLFLCWLIFPIFIIWLWVIIEMCVVNKDGNGVPFA